MSSAHDTAVIFPTTLIFPSEPNSHAAEGMGQPGEHVDEHDGDDSNDTEHPWLTTVPTSCGTNTTNGHVGIQNLIRAFAPSFVIEFSTHDEGLTMIHSEPSSARARGDS